MSEDREPTQTTPQGETIPVPARNDVLNAMKQIAKVPQSKVVEDGDGRVEH